jgi:tRNA nucleotidyltransferase (CCA-adding enzyme)
MMASKLQNILSRVQKKTTPSIKERKRILMLAEKLRKRVEAAANRAGLEVDVRVAERSPRHRHIHASPA